MVPTFTWGLSRSNLALATLCCSFFSQMNSVRRRANLKNLSDFRPTGMLLALQFADDLLGDVRRNLVVALELHGVCSPALRVRAYISCVSEHLRERHVCRH